MEKLRISTLADIESFEKTPLESRLSADNTYDMIKQGALVNPGATAISFIFSGEQYTNPMDVTYGEFLAQVNRTANLFHDLGIGPNDVISYLLPNIPQTHYVLWGGEAAGIVNPINPMLEPSTIADICKAAGTKVLVALGDVPGSDIWDKVEQIRNELPGLKKIVRVMGPSNEEEGIVGFDEVISNYSAHGLDSGRVISPDDIASMYHTGGTTGTPKLAPHTHYNEAAMAYIIGQAGELNAGETILCGLPLFHVNGTTVTGLFPFSVGARVVLLSPMGYRDPSLWPNFYKIVDFFKAVSFSAVPTILSVLLDIPQGNADISSLRYLICGAAPLSVELFQRFETSTGMRILEGYGLTEGTTASSINPIHGESRVGSIGLRLPYQEMKVFIVDEFGIFEREAEPDEIGCICIKGPTVFKGYLEERHNVGIWPQKGWFNTGDLGRMDKDGYFWLTGRKKELIIRGGHNIDPMVIEEPLYKLTEVQTAAAVARPDPYAGEVPVAYVQLQPGSELTTEEILEYLKGEIGERAAVPKEIHIVETIPLTPVGKIFKPALKWDAIGRVYSRELESISETAGSFSVKVGEDKVHGSLAVISVENPKTSIEELEERIASLLSNYTIKYRIDVV